MTHDETALALLLASGVEVRTMDRVFFSFPFACVAKTLVRATACQLNASIKGELFVRCECM